MATGVNYTGLSGKMRPGNNGEGPWWWDNFTGHVTIPRGTPVVVWSNDTLTITGDGGLTALDEASHTWILIFGEGAAVILSVSSGGIVAHRPSGGFIVDP